MVSFEKIPDLVGYLVLTEDGAVLESGGELKNDERNANVVTELINLTETVDPKIFEKSECQRISVIFERHNYTICLSNKRVYVAKRLNNQLQCNSTIQQPNTSSVSGFQTNNLPSEPSESTISNQAEIA